MGTNALFFSVLPLFFFNDEYIFLCDQNYHILGFQCNSIVMIDDEDKCLQDPNS